MAHIRKLNNTYNVQIRKPKFKISKSFTDLETAEMWAKYKEDLIDHMNAFEVPNNELVTLNDALEMKLKKIHKEKKDRKEVNDFLMVRKYLHDAVDKPINFLTYEFLLKRAEEMLNEIVSIGGHQKEGSGKKVYQSPSTVLRKFRVVSSILGNLIDEGINVENNALKICNYLRTKIQNENNED